MNKLVLGIALPFMFSSSVVLADSNYYIAANGSKIDNYITDEGKGFSVALGQYVANRFSIEAGYSDLGTIAGSTDAGDSIDVDVSALQLSGLGYLPLGNGGLFARVGAEMVTIEGIAESVDGMSVKGSDDETNVFYGIGGYYNISHNVDLRVEYQKHEVFDLDVETVNAGISFSTF